MKRVYTCFRSRGNQFQMWNGSTWEDYEDGPYHLITAEEADLVLHDDPCAASRHNLVHWYYWLVDISEPPRRIAIPSGESPHCG